MTGPAATAPRVAVVVGTGLIGTSIALALRERGTEVWLSDADPAAARLAAELGAGKVLAPGSVPAERADVAVLAVPPAAVAGALAGAQRQRLAACYTDVASVKELPLRAA
ncbi:MAG TPA: prephenate dehydrogenase/arogenate dehydrogenase family protein, partial [Streptosporangiaceae bacterium]